jgi:hypothetical protein
LLPVAAFPVTRFLPASLLSAAIPAQIIAKSGANVKRIFLHGASLQRWSFYGNYAHSHIWQGFSPPVCGKPRVERPWDN